MKIELSDYVLKVFRAIKKNYKKMPLNQIAVDLDLTTHQMNHCVKMLKKAKYLKRDKKGELVILK